MFVTSQNLYHHGTLLRSHTIDIAPVFTAIIKPFLTKLVLKKIKMPRRFLKLFRRDPSVAPAPESSEQPGHSCESDITYHTEDVVQYIDKIQTLLLGNTVLWRKLDYIGREQKLMEFRDYRRKPLIMQRKKFLTKHLREIDEYFRKCKRLSQEQLARVEIWESFQVHNEVLSDMSFRNIPDPKDIASCMMEAKKHLETQIVARDNLHRYINELVEDVEMMHLTLCCKNLCSRRHWPDFCGEEQNAYSKNLGEVDIIYPKLDRNRFPRPNNRLPGNLVLSSDKTVSAAGESSVTSKKTEHKQPTVLKFRKRVTRFLRNTFSRVLIALR
ncbi:hypothetical protein ScPMuIL_011934 [Solemya velum]